MIAIYRNINIQLQVVNVSDPTCVLYLPVSLFSQGEASRYIFLNKFRKFLQENASNRGVGHTGQLWHII